MPEAEMAAVDLDVPFGQRRPMSPRTPLHFLEEAAIVSAARDGDRTAFERLYERYARMVHGILLARVPRPEVDDLVQDVFLMAMKNISSLRETAVFGAWIATIARHRAHDYHRRSADTAELTENMPAQDRSEAEALSILSVIRTLPEAYRETLILRLVEGMSGPEIAARTGLTAGSVRVNLHRGMKQLRGKLAAKTTEDVHG